MVATSARSRHHHYPGNVSNIQPDARRAKRCLADPDCDYDPARHKKQRLTVDIPSRLSLHPCQRQHPPRQVASRPSAVVTTISSPDLDPARPPATSSESTHRPLPDKYLAGAVDTGSYPAAASTKDDTTQPIVSQPPQPVPKYKEKVVNGLRNELDNLGPGHGDVDVKEKGRKLRSQEATRFKSELSAYFPDYDEVIGNDTRQQHLLNLDTPIIVTDPDATPSSPPSPLRGISGTPHPHGSAESYPVRAYGDDVFTDILDTQKIDFGFLEARYNGKSPHDPLPDSLFEPTHKKAERLERSIRNSEKGRAQHERDQIARLLDGLQGHDWLRVMGVSGITESRKRAFEPAREHFIRGCQAILAKFRSWAAEEKRRKLEKERAIAVAGAEADAAGERGGAQEDEEEEEEEEEEDEDEDEAQAQAQKGRGDKVGAEKDEKAAGYASSEDGGTSTTNSRGARRRSNSEPTDCSDVDLSAAKQLREEAMAAAKLNSGKVGGRCLPPIPSPQKGFTSFFAKEYQRDAALNKSRRRGRTVMAWGHPVPEMPPVDFVLPQEYLDDETVKSRARQRRRDRRGRL